MATANQASLPPGWSQLDEFIFHPDQYHADSVPKGLYRDSVAKFIEARVNVATLRGPLVQTEKVMDSYDLQEACAHLRNLPQRKEKTPGDVMRSAVILRTLAAVCLPSDISFATDYAKYLIGLSSTLPEFQDLIWLNDALAAKADPALLKFRMEQRLRALDRARQSDYQAQLEFISLEDAMNVNLSRSQKANDAKVKILSIPDRSARIQEEIKMYLGIQYGYLEFLQNWAVRRLRRETWGPQPAQQFERADNQALRQDVASAFRTALASLAPSADVPKENLDSLRVRCLRAVEYFGDTLTPGEKQFVDKNAGKQIDALSK